MDHIKYVIFFFWLGPIFFLSAAVLRYINKHVSTPYILDIAASLCFLIGLMTELICENIKKKKPPVVENVMHVVYALAPIFYFIASIGRVLKLDSLLTNIMDLFATILFFTGTNIRLVLEIRNKKSNSHIAIVTTYWTAHLFFICAFISYIAANGNPIGNYFEIISGCFFVMAASVWFLGEILMRNCGLVLTPKEDEKDLKVSMVDI